MNNDSHRNREDHAFEALLVSQLRRDRDIVDSCDLPDLTAAERAAMNKLPPDLVERLWHQLDESDDQSLADGAAHQEVLTERLPRGVHIPAATPAGHRRRTRRVLYVMGGLAAALMLATTLLTLGSHNAWAQVAKALRSKPWIRFTLNVPAPQDVPERPLPETWISANSKIGARRFGKAAQYLDFARQISESYDPKQNSIDRRSIMETQNAEFGHIATLLRLIADDDATLQLPQAPVKVLERERREAAEGDRRWIEFTFKCHDDQRVPNEYRMTFRVDPQSHLPFEMSSTEKLFSNDTATVRSYAIDYPESGPDSIYAMGVPHAATIVNRIRKRAHDYDQLKELLTAYGKSRAKPMEPYSTVMLVSTPQMAFNDVLTAWRGRSDANGSEVSHVENEALMALRKQVWERKITIPNHVDPTTWWKQEIVKLPFEPPQGGDFRLPDAIGFPMLVGSGLSSNVIAALEEPACAYSLDPKPATGPAGTVLLKVRLETPAGFNDAAYWLAPERDYMVLRSEIRYSKARQDWDIDATIIDSFERSPGGHWYATTVRLGRIQNSGDDLPAKDGVGPTTTSEYRYFVEFK